MLNVLMRWIHISSMATLIGGMVYARLAMMPAIRAMSPEANRALNRDVAAAYRPMVVTAIAGLVLSGLYNLRVNPGHSPRYHMVLGVKLLLALHVFAAAILITKPENPRRERMMTGVVISGLMILAISAYLRRIF